MNRNYARGLFQGYMSKLSGKHPSETMISDHTYRIFSNDLNSQGTVFGGLIMAILDRVALVIAERHSGKICVTVSVDSINFLKPAGKGDNLIFKASINRAWNSSMEIGAKVLAEHSTGGEEIDHIVSAYFTFVALDEHKRPAKVPPVIPVTKTEKRRYEEAAMRRKKRIEGREEIKEFRKAYKK